MYKYGRRRWLVVMLAVVAGGLSAPAQSPENNSVELQIVRYADLGQLVTQHRGKVVVVDFWATFCPPCVASLPHMAQLRSKYAAEGLVVISVSLDQLKADPTKKKKVTQTLDKAGAGSLNVILDEEFEFVQAKLGVKGIPCAYVFDRDGKWVRFAEEEFGHPLIEQTVVQFLKRK